MTEMTAAQQRFEVILRDQARVADAFAADAAGVVPDVAEHNTIAAAALRHTADTFRMRMTREELDDLEGMDDHQMRALARAIRGLAGQDEVDADP